MTTYTEDGLELEEALITNNDKDVNNMSTMRRRTKYSNTKSKRGREWMDLIVNFF